MRVTSELWVSALLRRAFAAGGFAAVERRGAPEAGAIFIVTRSRLGELRLFGPAPQTSYDDARPSDRLFTELASGTDADAIGARIVREARFDPDLWLVEIEVSDAMLAELVPLRTP
jgi:hypothetical protein